MYEETLHQWHLVRQIFGAQEESFVISFEEHNARQPTDDLEALVVPRAVIDHVTETQVGVDSPAGISKETLKRDEIPMDVSEDRDLHAQIHPSR